MTYDDVASIEQVPSVYVDIAGNQDVLFAVHTHLSGLLGHSMVVGNTNWSAETTANAAELPAPAPEFLFAPTQIAKRTQEWGASRSTPGSARPGRHTPTGSTPGSGSSTSPTPTQCWRRGSRSAAAGSTRPSGYICALPAT